MGDGAVVRVLVRRYAGRTALLVALLVVAGAAEGFGLLTLLPLVEVALGGSTGAGAAERFVVGVLDGVGMAPTLAGLLVTLVLALWLRGLFRWLAMRQVGDTVARVARELREELLSALLAARWAHVGSERSGDVATALSRDAIWAGNAYRNACAALAALIEVVVYTVVVMVVSWRLGVLGLAGAAVLALVLGVFVRLSRRAGVDQTVRSRRLVSRLLDVLGGLKAIKAMGREGGYEDLLRREARSLERAERRQVLAVESLRAFQEPLLALLLAPVIYVIISGGAVAFTAVVVSIFLLHRLIGRAHQVQSEYQGMVAAESAFEALHRQVRLAESAREGAGGTRAAPALEQEIVFRGVSFERGGRRVVDAAELEIPAHRLVVLSGPSGSGKSTILDLLLGLRAPSSGQVLVDGVPLDEIDQAAWRRHVGYVPQEPILLHDTIAHNVVLGAGEVGDADVEAALRRAGAWEFVAALPGGIHAPVAERGASLSGGERQRIAIARALVRRPRLLVLDEATSELDAASEAAIWETLEALRSEMTIVAASHTSAAARIADRSYEVLDGRVRAMVAP